MLIWYVLVPTRTWKKPGIIQSRKIIEFSKVNLLKTRPEGIQPSSSTKSDEAFCFFETL